MKDGQLLSVTRTGFVPESGPIAELGLSDPPDEKAPNPDKARNPMSRTANFVNCNLPDLTLKRKFYDLEIL